MKYKKQLLSIEKLVEMRDQLKVNPEYQRGLAWSRVQRKMFVDSIFRGYPIPVIFLHEKQSEQVDHLKDEKKMQTEYEVIDGQQRINALWEYKNKLFAAATESEMKFPNFTKKSASQWNGKIFEDLDSDSQKQFLESEIDIVIIESEGDSKNEARDLFIRLQAGSALNDQEKRDAWPGEFTAFIFKLGGKYELPGNPGHTFFEEIMQQASSATDRGRVRKIAAQMYQLCSSFSERKIFSPINKESLDELYRINVGFDRSGESAKKFMTVLDTLCEIFAEEGARKFQNHEVFHLAIFVYSLLEKDVVDKKWKTGLKNAYEYFHENCVRAQTIEDKEKRSQDPYWFRYVELTKVSAADPNTIASRHEFFSTKVAEYMRSKGTLIYKDSQRLFTPVEREVIYFRDEKKCLMCEESVVWNEAEFHHVIPHSEGGKTALENGTLVHANCHPKGAEKVQKAQILFDQKKSTVNTNKQKKQQKRKISLPDETKARVFIRGKEHHAVIEGGKWKLLDSKGKVYAIKDSPSGAASKVTGNSVNGNTFWQVRRPDDENWRLLSDLHD